MREYEITYMSDPQLDDEARGQLDAVVDQEITSRSGMISQSSLSARRRLAYPVKKTAVGFLRTVQAQLDPEHVTEVRKTVSKLAGVLRLTILATPLRVGAPAEVVARLNEAKSPSKIAPAKKPSRAVTMAEVEEKIEEALGEEVK